jgi:hypothetical protein
LRSTGQQVLCARRLIEEVVSTKHAKLIAVFIDFSKAFDSVSWNYIENILLAYDVPKQLCKAIMSLYYGAKASVKINDTTTDFFDLGVGVLQGDTLAPYLFVIVVDWILRNGIDETLGFKTVERRSSRYPAKYLSDLDFADDIMLTSDNLKNMQKMLLSVEKWALKVGLKINVAKTEYMLFGDWAKELSRKKGVSIKTSAGVLKLVHDFKYLGSWLLNSSKDLDARKLCAWKAAIRLVKVWKSATLSRRIKVNLFRACIEPILLYNATCWTMTKTLARKLDGAYSKLLRYALNVHWKDHVTNAIVFGDIPSASTTVKLRRLTFLGHCWRSQQSALQPVSDLLFWNHSGTRRKGSRANFVKILARDTDRTTDELKSDMNDRPHWKLFIKNMK